MAKGKFIIEFDNTGELRAQLEVLLKGATLAALNEQVVSEAARLQELRRGEPGVPPETPKAEQAPTGPRGVLGNLGAGMSSDRSVLDEDLPKEQPTQPTKESPETPAEKHPAGAAATAGEQQVALTLETLGTAPYDDLLKFCEQNKVVGVDVEKNRQPFFRKLVEMRIRTHLETAAH